MFCMLGYACILQVGVRMRGPPPLRAMQPRPGNERPAQRDDGLPPRALARMHGCRTQPPDLLFPPITLAAH